MKSRRDGDIYRRYTPTAQVLHWIVALLMFAVISLAWVMVNMSATSSYRELLYSLHKSIGLMIFALVAVRIVWRATHKPPPTNTLTGHLESHLANTTHLLLYAVMIGMPVSGYLLSSAGGKAVSFFGLFMLPELPHDDLMQRTALGAHVLVGQWLVYTLILLHLIGVVFHIAIRRDGLLERMMPDQINAGTNNEML